MKHENKTPLPQQSQVTPHDKTPLPQQYQITPLEKCQKAINDEPREKLHIYIHTLQFLLVCYSTLGLIVTLWGKCDRKHVYYCSLDERGVCRITNYYYKSLL